MKQEAGEESTFEEVDLIATSNQKLQTFDTGLVAALKETNVTGKDTVNMEKSKAFKSLINDYLNHEYLASSQEEVEKISKILHGHQDLTETFLGPSNKVKKFKKRVQEA